MAIHYIYLLTDPVTHEIRYVGQTDNIDRRVAVHNDGKGARSTRGRVWFLLYAEKYDSRGAAMSREWHLKRDRAFRRQLADTTLGL